jgi:hypothetical protein
MANMSRRLVTAAVYVALFAAIWAPGGRGRLLAESVDAPATAPAKRQLTFELADGTLVTGRLDAAAVRFSMGSNRLSVPVAKLSELVVGLNDRPELTARIDKLIKALDSEAARDKAAAELTALGPPVEAAVTKYAASGSPARRAAIAEVLNAYKTWSASHPNAPPVTLEPFVLRSKISVAAESLVGSIATKRFTIDSPCGRHTVALAAIRRIRAAEVFTFPVAPSPPKSREIIVDMVNETRLRGATKLKTLTVLTAHGKFAIPLKHIMEIRFNRRPGESGVSVRCSNLDEILGRVAPKAKFPLKTPHGTVDLPLDQVASITISGGPLEAGLAHYWSFDKKDAIDKIGGVKGTVTAPVTFAKGIVGLAPVFRNYTTKIVLPSPRLNCNGWKQITFSAWLKFNSYSTYGNVYGRVDGKTSCGPWLATGGTYSGKWIGGNFGVRLLGKKHEMVSPASLKLGLRPYPKRGVWYHIVGTYDGRHVRVYFNGKLDGETKVATPGLAIFDSPKGTTVIGRSSRKNHASWRDTYFPGPVDEIKIWKRALSAAEVKLLHAQTLAKSKAATPHSAKK